MRKDLDVRAFSFLLLTGASLVSASLRVAEISPRATSVTFFSPRRLSDSDRSSWNSNDILTAVSVLAAVVAIIFCCCYLGGRSRNTNSEIADVVRPTITEIERELGPIRLPHNSGPIAWDAARAQREREIARRMGV